MTGGARRSSLLPHSSPRPPHGRQLLVLLLAAFSHADSPSQTPPLNRFLEIFATPDLSDFERPGTPYSDDLNFVLNIRRQLHQHPETMYTEHNTSNLIQVGGGLVG